MSSSFENRNQSMKPYFISQPVSNLNLVQQQSMISIWLADLAVNKRTSDQEIKMDF